MTTVVSKAFLATEDQGIPRHVLEETVDLINRGALPSTIDHDPSRPLEPVSVHAELRETQTGSLGVWLVLEVEESEYEKNADDMRGFSVTVTEERTLPHPDSTLPPLKIWLDARYFDASDYFAVVRRLERQFSVEGARVHRFNAVSDIAVLITMSYSTIVAIATQIAASALYDALRARWARSQQGGGQPLPSVRFRVEDTPFGEIVDCEVRSADEQTLRRAIETLPDVIRSQKAGGKLHVREGADEWERLPDDDEHGGNSA